MYIFLCSDAKKNQKNEHVLSVTSHSKNCFKILLELLISNNVFFNSLLKNSI